MKKLFMICVLVLSVAFTLRSQSPNPIVTRLSTQEITECKTPAAVAYNYIIACLNKNRDKIMALSTPESQEYLADNYDEFIGMFSNPDYEKLYIDSWIPVPAGCEIAVLYVQSENPSNYAPGTLKKVYINVVPSREIGESGFQDITRMFNTNVKVMVENIYGRWMVAGFK